MASVSFRGVSKTYPGGVRAVAELALDIEDGRFVVLLGPSGSGKTTTLRLVAGLEEATAGEILLDGRVVNRIDPKDRDVAMVFQNHALYPHLTVRQNVAFSLKLRGYRRAEIDNRLEFVATMLGLHPLLGRRPHALSGGQRQRVALGRAIARRPRVFLFDEPLSNLDAPLRVETRSELKRLHQRLGTTTIYVTHDQEEAMSLAEKVAVVRDGRLQQYAAPLEVYEQPANRFVAGFVGTPRMNFVEGRLTRRGPDLRFESRSGSWNIVPDRVSSLGSFVGRRLILGVRPEHLSLGAPVGAPEANASLPVTVGLTEPLGDRIHVHLRSASGQDFVARTDVRFRSSPGQHLRMSIDMRGVHFFEPDGEGMNVSPAAGSLSDHASPP